MNAAFEINAQNRNTNGKGASRRLRRNGQVPALVYGGQRPPTTISLNHNTLLKQLEQEAFYSRILQLNIDDKSEHVILKDLQRHPAKPIILHVDLMRVYTDKKLRILVPIHFLNEDKCVGVKKGGAITHNVTEVEIICLPEELPEFINLDISALEINQAIHIKDIVWPQGVELARKMDPKFPVVSIHGSRGAKTASEEPAATAAAPAKKK